MDLNGATYDLDLDGEGTVLLAPGTTLRYDLDAHGTVEATADFGSLPSRQFLAGFYGRLRGSVSLAVTEAGSETATRRLLGASRLAGFAIDGIPIRQEIGIAVELHVVTTAAGPVDLALQQEVDLHLDTALTCTDGTWDEQSSTAAAPLATFSLQTETGATAEVSVALTVWTRFYGGPVGRATAKIEESLVAETAAAPPHAFTRLDVQSTVTEQTEAGTDVLLAGHCAPWQGSDHIVLQGASFSLPEVRFQSPPAVVCPGVPAAFEVEIVNGVGNPVDESSIVWELDPSDPGSAPAALEVDPDRRRAVVRTDGAGTWELRCRLHGHALPTTAGTRVAAVPIAAPALIDLAFDPLSPEAVPG